MTLKGADKPTRSKTLGQSATRPYCFVSYSTREPHTNILIDCLRVVFTPHFDVTLTPSALESGASQREKIGDLIAHCEFAVVILDGLRPNVIFEYGIIQGKGRPVFLFKEAEATVDIKGLFGNSVALGVPAPAINLDSQFSDVKDVNFTEWNRFDMQKTVKTVWKEYCKKKDAIPNYAEIAEPNLWQ